MKKYKIEVYGWELESTCFSLDERQSTIMDEYIKENGKNCLSKLSFDIEDMLDIDMFDGDIFNISKPFYYFETNFLVIDNNKTVKEFNTENFSHLEDILDDYEDPNEYIALPDVYESNILLITHESKGGIYSFYVESEDIPKPKDFAIMGNFIDTPIGDYDIIEDIYFKGKKVEIDEWIGGDGKGFNIDYFKYIN